MGTCSSKKLKNTTNAANEVKKAKSIFSVNDLVSKSTKSVEDFYII